MRLIENDKYIFNYYYFNYVHHIDVNILGDSIIYIIVDVPNYMKMHTYFY